MASIPHDRRKQDGMAHHGSHASPYGKLAAMAALSFVAMYALMYVMVDRLDNVYLGLDRAYMAGLMTAPMVVIELALMGAMYPSRKANAAILAASVVLGIALWAAIRTQAAIGNEAFLRGMIPHHAGAVLMCTEAPITSPEIAKLCRQIVKSQNEEIEQMKALLARER